MLTLASESPRRAALLRSAGIPLIVTPTACDETPRRGETAVDYARRIAAAKLDAALAANPAARPVLVADTVVWHDDGEPIGKPTSTAQARALLVRLTTGDAHNVTTAWALASATATRHEVETTRVWMRPLCADELSAYLDSGEWRDKAGGYGIQGRAAGFVTRIEGSYTNVVGLPLAQVLAALKQVAS